MTTDQVRLTFIERCVRDYVSEVIQGMERSIIKKGVVDTGALKSSLSGHANGEVGKLIFKEYGRYIDMGVSKGNPLSNALKSEKKRKAKKIYSPIAYGKLNGLIGDLMYGLTEQTIQTIKTELENGSHLSN